MTVENLSVSINGDTPTEPIEIIVREGKARKVLEPQSYLHETNIEGPWKYVKARGVKKFPNGLFSYNFQKRQVLFTSDPNSEICDVIKGSLVDHPDLKAFGINKANTFDVKQLKRFILSKAHLFSDLDAARTLKRKLENFSYKFETEVDKADDRKGSTKDSIERGLKFGDELPDTINISTPLFLGEAPNDLELQLEIDVDGTTPKFSFYCLELEKMVVNEAESLISQQIENFEGKFPCLELI